MKQPTFLPKLRIVQAIREGNEVIVNQSLPSSAQPLGVGRQTVLTTRNLLSTSIIHFMALRLKNEPLPQGFNWPSLKKDNLNAAYVMHYLDYVPTWLNFNAYKLG